MMTKNTIWTEIKEDLLEAPKNYDHPFRLFTLATIGNDKVPRMRTLVLREVKEDLSLIFYTDNRTKKIAQIKENNTVSLLFYDSSKMVQLVVEGSAMIITNETIINDIWSKLNPANKKDYTTLKPPGTLVHHPEDVEYLTGDHHFCMVQIVPYRLEYLKIAKPNHSKVQYQQVEGKWTGEFLVP